MDPVEICAEKIWACNERFRYRDFYDLFHLVKVLRIDLNEFIKILPFKEIRRPITKENILKNLSYAIKEIENASDSVFYKETISNTKLVGFFQAIKLNEIQANI